jgi:hypothetical protein
MNTVAVCYFFLKVLATIHCDFSKERNHIPDELIFSSISIKSFINKLHLSKSSGLCTIPERRPEANGYSVDDQVMFSSALLMIEREQYLSRLQPHFAADRKTELFFSLEELS